MMMATMAAVLTPDVAGTEKYINDENNEDHADYYE